MAWLENSAVVVIVGLALAWLGRRLYRWWRRVKAFTQAEHASPCMTCASGGPSACQACEQVDAAHKPSYAIRPNLQIRVQGQGRGRRQGAEVTPLSTDASAIANERQQKAVKAAASGAEETPFNPDFEKNKR